MKQLWNQIEILNSKEVNGKTILQISVDASQEQINKYRSKGKITGEIKLDDKNRINSDQRKKIFATIKDISLFTGYEAEYLRDLFELAYCLENNIESFSLSNCSVEIARNFISYLIEICIEEGFPLAESALERTDNINRYLYICIKHSTCCLCGSPSIVYTIGNKKISLCDKHYDIAKFKGLKALEQLHKVYPIKI